MSEFQFLKHRRATEEETRHFYEHKHETFQQANDRGLKGKERFAFIYERTRDLQLYYSRSLDCVMFAPTDDEVFKHWCKHNQIAATDMFIARKVWDAAVSFYKQSNYDPETLKAVRAGEKVIRTLRPDEIRERSAKHERRFSS